MKWAATLAVAAAAVGLTSGECTTSGFTCVGGQCLSFFASVGTWFNQRSTCVLVASADLATVTDDLHNAVYTYVKGQTGLQDTCFWIGGTDQTSEGHWTWVYDGTAIAEGGPHWDPCEPEPDGGTDENYLAICPDLYYYKDYPGDYQHHAICQKFDETC